MADFLSDEWLETVASMAAERPKLPGVTATFSVSVAVARRREVRHHWRYEDGVPGAGGVGAPPVEPDLALSLTVEEAAAILDGSVEPSVSYMRGRLKAAGDGVLLLAFLESTGTPEFTAWREKLAGA